VSGGRYGAFVATFIGVLALCVSAYTAYVQRQQVRAQVWPILKYSTSNEPGLRLSLANKGVGPALIRHVVVSVDGEPLTAWRDVLRKLLGPQPHHYSQSTMSGDVLAPGEGMDILEPRDAAGAPLKPSGSGSEGALFDSGRGRIGVEICYCSTLGDCWTLRAGGDEPDSTVDTRRCPSPSARTFRQ
jgi:hypothetical protein